MRLGGLRWWWVLVLVLLGKGCTKFVLNQLWAKELEGWEHGNVTCLTLLTLFERVKTNFGATFFPRTVQEAIGLTQVANAIVQRVREDIVAPIFALLLASYGVSVLNWRLRTLLFVQDWLERDRVWIFAINLRKSLALIIWCQWGTKVDNCGHLVILASTKCR